MNDEGMTNEERLLVRTLIDGIQERTGNDLFAEMTEGLRVVTAGVLATGRPGSVTLTLSVNAVHFRATGRWAAGKVEASAEVSTKKPVSRKRKAEHVEFFVLDGGDLSATDPRQGSFADADR